jgi:hypothetical protein
MNRTTAIDVSNRTRRRLTSKIGRSEGPKTQTFERTTAGVGPANAYPISIESPLLFSFGSSDLRIFDVAVSPSA